MEFLRPATWDEALAAKAEYPTALPIAGGTDVMVELNFDVHRPSAILDLNRVTELTEWTNDGSVVRLGASVPYARIISELSGPLPGLALAAHTVGSPQIRNRGGVGGNLGAASPAGDSHPALLAAGRDVHVEAASVRGTRLIPIDEFYVGVKRNCLEADELIRAVHVPVADGPQQFSKIGTRNAMVIAVCAFGFALHPKNGTVGTGIGSAAPTPRRAVEAEEYLQGVLAERGLWESGELLGTEVVQRFGELVKAAASPIDDVRGTADYRRHALAVMARRTLTWCWNDYGKQIRSAA
ncbi:FAD binding domain-containing protein [Kitasatospora aureofaciens]|uniref:Carbon monoxide dehydrogenase n=1 Tax=Kitasatospora aureofaciens TaxID=1894 RepID=A0A1E7NDT4_KITAU|nr:FAD binding domain-containing protein [Kitasatospora aureofaciens]QEU98879.1 xanthine dehydrogenase family protein subunit M [Streptomyces viridifaciens]ARF77686.1 carbon monoxide dehydrogenase [Kitasatospora aureofaciens]OEV38653.1 carbon monoxide dehydrogenase [Kitasatospora aureofaciens]UKZ04888.1 FAD binding domain-containing protein [Streptomyces viridifaciens]GGU74743.1 carbon monoxide dehydrogenase [Kitasatospora aureofaciens]